MIKLLSSCVISARRAGQICRDVLSSGKLGVVDKSEGGLDPQTEADRKAQRCIVSTIADRFPGLTVYGEETLEPSEEEDRLLVVTGEDQDILKEPCPQEFIDLQEKDIIVWVDPLDGTKEYTEGFIEHVTVLIGIAVRGEPVAGVIHRPFSKRSDGEFGQTYWVLKGLGSRGLEPRQTAPPQNTDDMSVVFTRSHYTELVRRTVAALNPRREIRVGGCGHKTMMVVAGDVDAYVFPSDGTKKWDTCAVDAFVRANGGLLTDVNGKTLDYGSWENWRNKMGLVVTMGKETHQAILDRIPADVKEELASKL